MKACFETAPTLLVVDDDMELLEVLNCLLVDNGFNVICANCGEEAVRIFSKQKEQIDLTLLDIEMSGISGLDVLMEIKRINPQAKTIIMSGNTGEDMLEKLRLCASGIPFLKKPFTGTALCSEIMNVLIKGSLIGGHDE